MHLRFQGTHAELSELCWHVYLGLEISSEKSGGRGPMVKQTDHLEINTFQFYMAFLFVCVCACHSGKVISHKQVIEVILLL